MPPVSVSVSLTNPTVPPYWALLERELLQGISEGCVEFFEHYFDQKTGYGLWTPRWGGNDGPDDGAENGLNWTILYALGAPEVILELWRKGWEGHLKQYTEAHTIEASPEAASTGMYYKEWNAQFDYFHHTEGMSAFTLQGLAEPYDPKFIQRTKTYSAMYMGDDPEAPNYDKEKKLVKSLFTGSRGPMLRKATGLDWAGDRLVLPDDGGWGFRRPGEGGRVVDVPELLAARNGQEVMHHEESYQQMIDHFEEYTDVAGDHPLNLGSTTQVFNAFALTGDQKYYNHIVDYVDAWAERTAANGGVIPSNIGLDGTIGGEADGNWWGGTYGWGFNCVVPQTGERVWRSAFGTHAAMGFGNAILLTGDVERYAGVWRGVLDAVNANTKEGDDGQILYPHVYGAFPGETPKWDNYSPTPWRFGANELYYWTQNQQDLTWAGQSRWRDFLAGSDAAYPEERLAETLERLRSLVDEMRHREFTNPTTRLSDDMNHINPAHCTEALVELMLGGIPVGRIGYPLHCRLRYFDLHARRAGLPAHIAALVEAMDADSVTVQLVNTSSTLEQTVVLQGGAYGEHALKTVSTTSINGASLEAAKPISGEDGLGNSAFAVTIQPGCAGRLKIGAFAYSQTSQDTYCTLRLQSPAPIPFHTRAGRV